MSTKEDYDAKIGFITAIDDNQIKTPTNIPVDNYVQESENLYHWCKKDQVALTGKGMSWDIVTDLPLRCGALREAESVWNLHRFSREDAAKQWAEDSPEAYDLRNELLHEFRFAYRNDADLSKKVNNIADGAGHADMLQDLNDLSLLGKKNPDPLTAISFDMTLLDAAAQKADELAALYAIVTGDRSEYNEAKKIRDKAYTYLKESVDEIFGYGQYLFWQDEDRKQGYRSNYLRRKKLRREAAASTSDSSSPDPQPDDNVVTG